MRLMQDGRKLETGIAERNEAGQHGGLLLAVSEQQFAFEFGSRLALQLDGVKFIGGNRQMSGPLRTPDPVDRGRLSLPRGRKRAVLKRPHANRLCLGLHGKAGLVPDRNE